MKVLHIKDAYFELSEKILDDVIKRFSPIMYSNMPIESRSIGGRIIEFALK